MAGGGEGWIEGKRLSTTSTSPRIFSGKIGVSPLHPPDRYHAWLPEDPFERVQFRGERFNEGHAGQVAGPRSSRQNPFPAHAGRQIIGRGKVQLLQIPRDRLRIPWQGKSDKKERKRNEKLSRSPKPFRLLHLYHRVFR